MLYINKVPTQAEASGHSGMGMTNDTDRLQTMARAFSLIAAFEILMDFISPAMWILTTPGSITAKVANMSLSAPVLGGLWIFAAVLVVPFVLMQVFNPEYQHRRGVIKLCNYGNIAGALIWFFMAFLARNLDYEYIILNFVINGIGGLAMATLLAIGLNNDQIEGALLKRKAKT